MTRIFTLLFSILILSGCCSTNKKEFEFDDNEPKHISCYKAGDTLFFESSTNDLDTITVLDIDSAKGSECTGFMAPPSCGKSCWVTLKHLPVDKWHGVTTSGKNNDTVSIDYQTLIHIIKDPIKNKTFFDFDFKDFCTASENILGKLYTDTLKLNGKKIANYYFINHGFPERVTDSANIQTLIWTDEYGLTAYMNKYRQWWTITKLRATNSQPRDD